MTRDPDGPLGPDTGPSSPGSDPTPQPPHTERDGGELTADEACARLFEISSDVGAKCAALPEDDETWTDEQKWRHAAQNGRLSGAS